MNTPNAFKAELLRLVGETPDVSSLQQAQYAYGRIIYLLGLRILEAFPEAAIGPPPHGEGGSGIIGIDGQKPGGYINTIIKVAGTALCLGQPCQSGQVPPGTGA
jgi:hypothetical protein